MRAVIQRVSSASVTIDGAVRSSIGEGLLVLLGIGHEDTKEDIGYLVKKISGLRVFNDENGEKLSFRKFYKNDGTVEEAKVKTFLDKLGVVHQGETSVDIGEEHQ